MMTKLLLNVKADTNDADYIENTKEITQKTLEFLDPLFKAIAVVSERKKHDWNNTYNWPTSEYRDENTVEGVYEEFKDVTPTMLKVFDQYVPYGEYGVHTIEHIHVLEVVRDEFLLKNR